MTIVPLGFALCLGALNFFSVRRWMQKEDALSLSKRTPALIEAEMCTAMIILLAETALASQPLAVDVSTERASTIDVLQVFLPKLPQLVLPSDQEMLARAASSSASPSFPSTHDKLRVKIYKAGSSQIAQKDKRGYNGIFSMSRIAQKYMIEFMNYSVISALSQDVRLPFQLSTCR